MVKKKTQLAMLNSMMELRKRHQELCEQPEDLPHILLVSAQAGSGKTTALTWLAEEVQAIYVRAMASDTVVSFLSRLMVACNLPPNTTRGNSVMTQAVSEHLYANDITLIVDEVDFLFGSARLIETLRDIHDLARVPVIMAGHIGLEKRMAGRPQLHSRVSVWMEFQPLNSEDLQLVARKAHSGLMLDDDLVKHVLTETRGNLRLSRVALERIAQFAEANSQRKVTREQWGKHKLFLTHRTAL